MTESTPNPTLDPTRPPILPLGRAINVLATAAALAGLLAAAFEYGFWHPPLPLAFLRTVQVVAAAALVIHLAGRFEIAPDRRELLSRRWPDLAILALLAIGSAALVGRFLAVDFDSLSMLDDWCGLVALFIAAQTLLHVVRLVRQIAHSNAQPVTGLVAGFLALILLGTAGLMLPRSVPQGLPLQLNDALFTATSATTLTGLTTRVIGSDQIPGTPERLRNPDLPEAEVSLLGQGIILALIQLGGLGMMIFATIFALRAGWLRPAEASMKPGQLRRVVRFIVAGTLLVEAIGAAMLYTMVAGFDWPTGQKVFFAAFHSVSGFCNAGFTLTPDSFIRYHAYWQVHCVIAPLVVLGGLGWPVLMNLCGIVAGWFGGSAKALNASNQNVRNHGANSHSTLTLHSRLAISATGILLAVGVIGLMLTESPLTGRGRVHVGMRQPTPSAIEMAAERKTDPDPHQMRRESTARQLVDSLFLSVNARSGGFTTVETNYNGNALGDASLFLLTLLMMIGGSPGSAGGGLKTVTFVLIVLGVVSIIRGSGSRSGQASSPGKPPGLAERIPAGLVRRAMVVFFCYFGFVLAVTFVLTITESASNVPFMQLLFEAVSGTTSTGLATGLTSDLTLPGQVVMMLAMLVGRLGPLALLMAITPTHGNPCESTGEGVAIG